MTEVPLTPNYSPVAAVNLVPTALGVGVSVCVCVCVCVCLLLIAPKNV